MIIRSLTIAFVCFSANFAKAEAAQYQLKLDITWSEATHEHNWPEGSGHMSRLIGASHHSRYIMFADGRSATSGLKSMAENGRTAIMRAELDEATRRNRIGAIFAVEGLKKVPGTMTVSLEVTPEHSRVSFTTMIAPSPDWFTGLSSVELRRDEAWVDEVKLPLWAWDSGTDSGSEYIAPNDETQPVQSTRLLASQHFLGEGGLKPVGCATFTRISR